MKLKKLLAAILTVTLAGLSLTSIASAQTGPRTTTVPVFGTDLVITIVTDGGTYQSATIAADSSAADGFVVTSSSEHSGFEVNFTNSTTGVEIEVNVVDGAVTKTEVDTHSPGENGGPGVWTGDPLGNGDTVIISYDVTLGTDGVPVITVPAPTFGADTFFVDLGSKTSTHEGETIVTHSIQIYNASHDDGNGHQVQDSVNLVIRATVEHGQLKVEAAIVDPSSNKGHDDDESDDLKSDDLKSDDLKSDDESHDSSLDDESDGHKADDESHISSPDDESHSGSPEVDDD